MTIRFTAVFASLLMMATPVFAEDASIQSIEQKTIADSIERGKMLFNYDQAAWHSTDTFVEMAGELKNQKLVGRVVVPLESGYQAIYYGKNDSGRYAIFSGTWNGTKIVDAVFSKDDKGPLLSPQANSYADAAELLTSGKLETKDLWFCNKATPNFVLLPGSVSGEYSLYVMTAQEKNDSFPLGGHHRYDIRNGKSVGTRTFTKSCIDLEREQKPDKKIEAFYITHLLDPAPTEIHVFSALASKTSILVGTATNGKSWSVEPKDGSVVIKPIEMPK
jgi:hypothetical protein